MFVPVARKYTNRVTEQAEETERSSLPLSWEKKNKNSQRKAGTLVALP